MFLFFFFFFFLFWFFSLFFFFFFFNDTATTEIYTLSLHDALPIDGLLAAEQDLPHLDRVAGVLRRDDGAHVGLVRQRLKRVHHVEVARVERPVLGLDHRAARRVHLREGLAEPDEVLEVRHLGVAA